MSTPFDPTQLPNPLAGQVPGSAPDPVYNPMTNPVPHSSPALRPAWAPSGNPYVVAAPPAKMKPASNRTGLVATVVLLSVALIAVVGVVVWQWSSSSAAPPQITTTPSPPPSESPSSPASTNAPVTPDPGWIATMCGSKWDIFTDVVVTGSGKILAVGKTKSFDHDFEGLLDVGQLRGDTAGVIAMFDSDGELVSIELFPDMAFYAAVTAPDGTVYIGGTELVDGNPKRIYLRRVTADGQFLMESWKNKILDEQVTRIAGLKANPDNSVLAYGDFEAGDHFIAYFKTDSTLISAFKVTNVAVTDFVKDSQGNIYIVGTESIDNVKTPEVIVKYSSRGEMLSRTAFFNDETYKFFSIAVTKTGVVVVGETSAWYGSQSHRPDSDINALLYEVDFSGNTKITQSYGGSGPVFFTSVEVGKDGSFFVTGSTNSKDGDFPYLHGGSPTGNDAFVAKISSDGTVKWFEVFGGSELDQLHSLAITDTGVVAAGVYYSSNGNLPQSCGDGDLLLVSIPRK
ncbi:MAG: hypothetical protein FWD55_05885 [Propionibacteriaceae bacterium]|nr:hypothetical protein [Propionibacteriaceae bacterium]